MNVNNIMKWISVKDKLPEVGQIIVALINYGEQQNGYPICDVIIEILKVHEGGVLWTRGFGGAYYLPTENLYGNTFIDYWMPWEEFGFPESIIKSERNE